MQSVAKRKRTKKLGLTTKPFAMNCIKIVMLSKLVASYSFMAVGVGNVRTKRSHPKHSAHTKNSYPNNIISMENSSSWSNKAVSQSAIRSKRKTALTIDCSEPVRLSDLRSLTCVGSHSLSPNPADTNGREHLHFMCTK